MQINILESATYALVRVNYSYVKIHNQIHSSFLDFDLVHIKNCHKYAYLIFAPSQFYLYYKNWS